MYADDAVLLIMPKKKAAVSVSAAEVDASLSPAADAAPLSPVDAHTAHLQHLLQEGAALNKDAIRHACRQDGVPHVLRGAVWQVLLDVWGRDDDTLFDANVSLDLKDQSVIQVDLERTRTDEPTFAHKAARDEAAALLTLYVCVPVHDVVLVCESAVVLLVCRGAVGHMRQVLQAPQCALQSGLERDRRPFFLHRRTS
jgi:hypothetical protein